MSRTHARPPADVSSATPAPPPHHVSTQATVTVRSAAFTIINISPLTSLRPRIKYTRRSRVTSGPRTAPRPGPGPAPDSRLAIGPPRRRRARLGSGVRAVSGCVGGLGSAWSGHAAVPRPSSDTLFQGATVPHGHGGHARRRAQQITRHRATQLSVSQTRDTHSTHSVHTAQQCSMCRMSNTARSPGSRVEFGSQKLARNGPARGMAANAHKRGCLHRATVEDGCYGC